MRIVDLHSHWGIKRGYVLRSADALTQQKSTWNSTPTYDTEEKMAAYPLFRYERLVRDWKDLGYTDDILERVFHRNAERLFGITEAK